MTILTSLLGASSAIFGAACIIRSAIGIRRGQRIAHGRGDDHHGHHDHKAVREGLLQIAVGLTFLLFGVYVLVSAAVHA